MTHGSKKSSSRRDDNVLTAPVSTRLGAGQSWGRRQTEFRPFTKLIIPLFLIKLTEIHLRKAGVVQKEGFLLWAGTLSQEIAFVSTIVAPEVESGAFHGSLSSEIAASCHEHLDSRDLIPIAQVHSHPEKAFLSAIDARRPFLLIPGFLSIIIPDFGFVDMTNTDLWSVHQYLSNSRWAELRSPEKADQIIIDDTLIQVK